MYNKSAGDEAAVRINGGNAIQREVLDLLVDPAMKNEKQALVCEDGYSLMLAVSTLSDVTNSSLTPTC
jgi:hypothetical protein